MTDAVTHAITLQALWNHVEDLKGRKGLEVLDVGCGHGYLTLAMARLFEGSRVTGVDIHGRAVDVAKGIWEGNFKELNVEFVCEDVDKDGAKVLSKDYDIIHCGFFVK
jgi:2-polyprenyl-3-methyl-5-hydroxy-6-metoxy-1,4-benzoquinol methylase